MINPVKTQASTYLRQIKQSNSIPLFPGHLVLVSMMNVFCSVQCEVRLWNLRGVIIKADRHCSHQRMDPGNPKSNRRHKNVVVFSCPIHINIRVLALALSNKHSSALDAPALGYPELFFNLKPFETLCNTLKNTNFKHLGRVLSWTDKPLPISNI